MGRVKTKQIKRVTKRLVFLHGENFKNDFDANKKLVGDFVETKSKKLRNVVAGYVTRLMRETKE